MVQFSFVGKTNVKVLYFGCVTESLGVSFSWFRKSWLCSCGLRQERSMEDREEIWQGSSNVLVVPVEYSIQRQEQYPEKMSEHLQQAENVQHREQDDRDADEIIARGKHHSPAELQKGLTVFTAAVFIIGEMAGSGVLALPAAIVGAGWTGFGMLVVCCFASGYCGTVLGRSWSILRERHDEYKGHVRYPYPAIGEKAYGRWASVTVTVCINITLIGKRVIFQYNLNRRKRRIILHRHATCFSRSLYA